jgi:hypothetical protein
MRLRHEGTPLPDSATRLLTDHGFTVVERGRAAGSVRLVEDTLVLALPVSGEATPHAEGAAAGLTWLGGGTIATSAGISAGVVAAAANRRKRGQRTGPRPVKPRRGALERIAVLRAEGRSLRDIASVLEAEGYEPASGKTWWATTVKRTEEAGVAETRIVLRRVGQILAEVRARGSVGEDELRALGREYRFHHHRLLRAFEEEVGAPYLGRFTPVLRRRGSRYAVSSKGLTLLAMWDRSEVIDDDVEDILLDVSRSNRMTEKDLVAWCNATGVAREELVPRFLTGAQELTLTDEGREVADTWRRIVDPDPRERLDIDFWPTPDAESRLSAGWDWEDDPLV